MLLTLGHKSFVAEGTKREVATGIAAAVLAGSTRLMVAAATTKKWTCLPDPALRPQRSEQSRGRRRPSDQWRLGRLRCLTAGPGSILVLC